MADFEQPAYPDEPFGEPEPVRRFEYMVVSEISGKKLTERLNELGSQGWEAVLHAHPGTVLKRELR